MAMTKYASFEVSEVLDLKGSNERIRTASLDKLSDFNDYRTEDGYLYARIRAISSRVNKNHDGWPSVELAGGPEIFEQHTASTGGFTVQAKKGAEYGFATFLGKPVFVDHHNSNPDRARGVIVDAKLHVEDQRTASLDPYYASAPDNHKPPTWVELLLEIDAKSFPRFAKAIVEGAKDSSKGIDGFSMGCNVEMSKCSHCGNEATAPDEYCQHIKAKGAHFDYIQPDGTKTSKRSYEDCYGIQFFEISGVFDPADETALIREVRSSVNKEAAVGDGFDSEWGGPGENYQEQHQEPGTGPIYVEAPFRNSFTGQDDVYRGPVQKIIPRTKRGEELHDLVINPMTVVTMRPNEYKVIGTDDLNAAPTVPPDQPEHFARVASTHEALAGDPTPDFVDGNQIPQADMLKSPESVDTLRDEKICPVCGDTMDDEECQLCGYVEEPEGFDNPDLTKARDDVQGLKGEQQQLPGPAVPQEESELRDRSLPPATPGAPPSNAGLTARVTGDMARWTVLTSTPKTAGRINTVERPIKPGTGQATGEPSEQVLSDQSRPVTSHVRTAGDFIAAAGRDQEKNMKTADAASGAPADATPDQRVDVTGVGGVMDGSNDAASKADAQVDVEGIGSTGVDSVGPDSTDSIEETSDNAGFDTSKTTDDSGPTKTWGNGSGVEEQRSPVTNDVFPASAEGVKKSHDDAAFPAEDGGLAGGKAVEGVQPVAEQFGERQNVLDHTTSPANNSGATKTWSGTDGNGVTKQVDPVTTESIATEGFGKGSSQHLFTAMKLADLEVELGLLNPDRKFDRVAQLAEEDPTATVASLKYAQRVKTAGLAKGGQRTAKRMPVMGRQASTQREVQTPNEGDDSALFM